MNRTRTLRVALVVALMAVWTTAATAGPGKRILEPFDYQGVTLEDGNLKRQFDETRHYYLQIPNDDLLKGFRTRAGVPAPGVDLGGWYTSDTFPPKASRRTARRAGVAAREPGRRPSPTTTI